MKKILSSIRLTILFAFFSFFTFLFVSIISLFLIFLINNITDITRITTLPLVISICSSFILGFIISVIIAKRPLKNISTINEAVKKVANGDFSVKINEDEYIIKELHEMAVNFNIMTNELKNNEMLSSDFITNVSHEFKTPLSAIEGYATLLQSPNEEKKQEYVNKIIENTERLSNLTGNILTLSKLEEKNIEQSIKLNDTFLLDEDIRKALLLFETAWTTKNITLNIDLEEVKYTGNKILLFEVWQNIISNAIKYTNENGTIEIKLYNQDNIVYIEFKDNGIGMDEETIKHIFDKFYQGDKTHSSKGNGLGLSIVKKIIEIHNGDILIESKKNIGTKFTIILKKS